MKENFDIHIDAVYTWVDGFDKRHMQKMLPFFSGNNTWKNAKFRTRFQHVNEIEFSIKSIIKFAPFIQNIFIVTDHQTPSFLERYNKNKTPNSPNITVIDHTDIFTGYEQTLPVFNGISIETLLYKIPNLSEHFIYFNDDFSLFKPLKPTDFFINGYPVLRGKWSRFENQIWYKFLYNKWLVLLGKPSKENKYGYKRLQQSAARKLGFTDKYFRINHTPIPMRKSTFEIFFSKYPDVEKTNVMNRFRNPRQLLVQSLANHLEIKNNTANFIYDFQLLYYGSYDKPLFWLKYRLWKAKKNKNTLFLCMQSLDLCPERKRNFLLLWLKEYLATKENSKNFL